MTESNGILVTTFAVFNWWRIENILLSIISCSIYRVKTGVHNKATLNCHHKFIYFHQIFIITVTIYRGMGGAVCYVQWLKSEQQISGRGSCFEAQRCGDWNKPFLLSIGNVGGRMRWLVHVWGGSIVVVESVHGYAAGGKIQSDTFC